MALSMTGCSAPTLDMNLSVHSLRNLREWTRQDASGTYNSYEEWAATRSVRERLQLVDRIACKIGYGELPVGALLVVIACEEHGSVVEQAVVEYLQHVPCHVDDELGAMRDVIELVQTAPVANRGAVVAALVGIGDRRINGVMRIVRRVLNVDEVRQFSRCVPALMKANHVEFCLDWLIQAYREGAPRPVLTSLTCTLMLVAIKDDLGIVEEEASPGVGFSVRGELVLRSREGFSRELVSRLSRLKDGRDVDYEIDKVIHLWQNDESAVVAA